jgi:hypothetical protein
VLEDKASLGVEIKDAYTIGNRDKLYDIATKTIPQLLENIDVFFTAFEKQWHMENSSIGFEIHCTRIGALRFRVQYVANVLLRYCERKIDRIEELEEETLPFAYMEGATADNYQLMCWNNIITSGINW